MRVAVYHSNNDLRIEERPCPQAGVGELLLRVESSGICGSDLMEWYRVPRAPLVLGHEVAGVVTQVGVGVDRFSIGDRVVTTHHVPCGDCRYCRTDRESVCETLRTTSFDPGGFAEFVRLPAINVTHGTFHLPDGVTFDEGSFVEPLACVVRGQRLVGVRAGDSVAVLGAGVSGILHLQYAREQGAGRLVATDMNDQRLELAQRFGADDCVRADTTDLVDRVRAANGGRGVDRVIVCTGATSAFQQALALVDLGGSVLFFAPTEPGQELSIDVNDLWRRNISIVHSYAGPPADMRRALELIRERRIDVAAMVTDRLALDAIGKGFQAMQSGGPSLKVMIRPHG